jgi:3-hydroxybutyryl-CoA dehydrogenase
LYVVATPLGNLQDMSLRALAVLRAVDAVACEDTRHSQRLLDAFGIKTRLVALHEHNEQAAAGLVIRMLEEGVASAEDIDRAIRLAYRHPVGPLKLSDIVGLDVRLDIARQLQASLGDRFAPPQLLIDMVARGSLGKKSGKGFYDWD